MTETTAGTALAAVFDRIYIVNLAHRADRRADMARQLARIGLTLDHPQVVLWPASRFDAAEGFPSPAVRGCFDSHLRVLEDVCRTGISRALVLEDDADFAADAPARLPGLCHDLRAAEWGLLYGWPPRGTAPHGAQLVDLAPDTRMLMSHFYGIRGATAGEMADYLRAMRARPEGDLDGGPMHFDGAMNWFRRDHPELRCLVPDRPIAVQRPSRSDIHASAWYDRVQALAPALSAFRRIKARVRG